MDTKAKRNCVYFGEKYLSHLMDRKTSDFHRKLIKIIHQDQIKGETEGFGNHMQGKLMNSKNIIMNKIILDTYTHKKFIVPCSAGSLFGVIYANGDTYPCEILNKKLGNLRDYDMNFMKLWKDKKAKSCRNFIKKSKCSCTFECVWTLNIISNFKFIFPLVRNAIKCRYQ